MNVCKCGLLKQSLPEKEHTVRSVSVTVRPWIDRGFFVNAAALSLQSVLPSC